MRFLNLCAIVGIAESKIYGSLGQNLVAMSSSDWNDEYGEGVNAMHLLREDAMRVQRCFSEEELTSESQALIRYIKLLYGNKPIRRIELATGPRIDELFGRSVHYYFSESVC